MPAGHPCSHHPRALFKGVADTLRRFAPQDSELVPKHKVSRSKIRAYSITSSVITSSNAEFPD
jgi:hypothetical protein